MKPRIIVIGRFVEDRVFVPALAGARRYAKARGWDVETIGWNEARTGFPKALQAPPRPLGFIVEGSNLPPDLPRELYGDTPVVFLNCTDTPRDARFAHLLLDDSAVARTAFRELSASLPPACAVVGYCLGRRRWSSDRATSFRAEAAKSGLPCHSFDFLDPRTDDASGEPARLTAWLASLPRRCAVFAVNDETAAVVAEAARAARLDIPRHLTLLGADNDAAICEASHPTLSSIQMDFESAGFQSARILNEMVSATKPPPPVAPTAGDSSGGHSGGDGPGDAAAVVLGPLMAVRRESTRGAGRREPRILDAVEIIRGKACEGLTVKALAARFPGSRSLFEKRFREAMGHSALDEILHVRMENVHTLLSRTDVPLAAIADFCGFRSDRALRKFFRSREAMSMTEWRNLHSGRHL